MKRKHFIQLTTLATTGGLVLPWACDSPKRKPEEVETIRKNWAGNYTYTAEKLHEPATVEEVQQLV